ncbi:hypothetical protein [Streptomyces sp. SBT349]|uniref:hypothetical protein n=1 Tax=Streptomyces sp. SBT349 TaxID=1580539 RepID=UPI00066E454E|nr:hypothetical protein [Streptomyces sp. SBT349]
MSAPLSPERLEQLVELAEMSGPDSAIAHAVTEITRLRAAVMEVAHMRAERDAWRDQRNAVYATNERLREEVQESDLARLLAENDLRTAMRELRNLRKRAEGGDDR